LSKEKWLLKEIDSWVSEGIILQETAEDIRRLYEKKNSISILLIVFSIIGAVLIGTGIILISAKNWYDIPMWARIGIAFTPLILAQALSVYVLLRRMDSLAWREGTAIFLSLAVFTVIALVGQIFHLPGDFGNYILVCGLLSLPIIYILWATSPVIIYLWTILNWTALNSGEFHWYNVNEYIKFWLLLFALFIIPFIFFMIRSDRYSVRGQYLAWITAISGFFGILFLNISLSSYLSVIPVIIYFCLIYVLDMLLYNEAPSIAQRPFKIIGWLGNIVLLLVFSYSGIWYHEGYSYLEKFILSPYSILCIFMIIPTVWMFIKSKKEKNEIAVAVNVLLLPILLVFFKSVIKFEPITILAVIINFYLLTIGVLVILAGVKHISLGYTNIGMILVCLLIVLRFFDWEFDLLQRGIAFVLIGIGFLTVNLYMIKKKKAVAE